MIPADVASRLRLNLPDQPTPPQPVAPSAKLADVLSDLVPGQRLLAEIQVLLPNGTYRAIVAQRDVTLALPFSAKPGDSLELEVVESDGKLTLAFLANRSASDPPAKGTESVSTTLSQTGKLIGDLLGNIDDRGKGSQPAALNGNQPLLGEAPKSGAELVPVLKEALAKSGMFYEAHQARWAEGKLPTAALLQEPQGKLSAALHSTEMPLPQGSSDPAARDANTPNSALDFDSLQKASHQNSIPADLAPLVRQQLDALASQTYVWQGQVWPGQQMHWEIEDKGGNHRGDLDEDSLQRWQTRLRLKLPSLGGIDAVIRLQAGGAIDLSVITDSTESRHTLIAAGEELRRQFDDAGLSLTALSVQHGEIPE